MVSVGTVKGRMAEIKENPEAKKYFTIVVISVISLIILTFVIIISGLSSIAKSRSGLRASDIIEGTAVSTERNAAGGLIVDINYNEIIGYDANRNPIYAPNGLLPAIMGYDMCGTPIELEGIVVTEQASDSLPIYGNVSSIDSARRRGLAEHGTNNVSWNSIVGYGQDNNPIFAANIPDPEILGYDVLGTGVAKGTVVEVGRTSTGMPIYDYSVIMKAKQVGIAEQERILAEKSLETIMSGEEKSQ